MELYDALDAEVTDAASEIELLSPGTARKYLVEAAWQGVYRSPTIRAYFQRILHGRKERRKIALVATAHYLVRCMYAMLISGPPWREAA